MVKLLPMLLIFASACVGSLPPKLRPGSDITLPPPASVGAKTVGGRTCASGNAAGATVFVGDNAKCGSLGLDTLPHTVSPPARKP